MTNALVPTGGQWKPPQRKYLNWLIIGAVAVAGAFAFNAIAPTFVLAGDLLVEILKSWTNMIIYGVIFAIIGFFAWDLLLPGGKLNTFLRRLYDNAITQATWWLWRINPLTPLYERKQQLINSRVGFDEAYANFQGKMSRMKERETEYRREAADAERRGRHAYETLQGKGAKKLSADQETMLRSQLDEATHQAGSFTELANEIGTNRSRLEPVLDNVRRIRESINQTLARMDTDIRVAQERWEMRKDMNAIDAEARNVLHNPAEFAQQALDYIDDKYAEQIGRLENLRDITQPMLDRNDLERGMFSSEYIDKWTRETHETLQLEGPKEQPIAMSQSRTRIGDLID